MELNMYGKERSYDGKNLENLVSFGDLQLELELQERL